jgi:hypothetical protein
MGQGRDAHAQSAFFLAGLLFLPASSAGARESDADVDAIIRRCRGMRDLGGEVSRNIFPALISAMESLDFVESDPSHGSVDNHACLDG